MKQCPYCNESISYGTLMKYSTGSGLVKYEPCPHCNETYKVTLNTIFLVALCVITLLLTILVFKSDSRLANKAYIFAVLLLALPLFPVFIKLSEKK